MPCEALEEALKPMQEAVRRVQSRVTFPEKTSMVEVYPGAALFCCHVRGSRERVTGRELAQEREESRGHSLALFEIF